MGFPHFREGVSTSSPLQETPLSAFPHISQKKGGTEKCFPRHTQAPEARETRGARPRPWGMHPHGTLTKIHISHEKA